ncbi:MAG: ABC-type sulfate/molybdate transport systems ATPase subunit [Pseudohongiellaceae bacterium]|jgi:ABC-type sulfate/molybdate transport systems ATPase subunit
MTTASSTTHLSVTGLALGYGDGLLVEDLTLTLSRGERLVIVGASGAGKSTLMAVLAGLAEPAAGQLQRPDDPPGMLFQDGALWPHMTVARHVSFVDPHHDQAWQDHLLEVFQLSELRQRRPEQLSGGERLRLGLARALAPRPSWVLLDEPLAHLDPALSASLREKLPLLVAELGATQVTVTHDPDDVLIFGDRLLSLEGKGHWWLGETHEGLEEPPTPALAAFSDRGTILTGRSDDQGRADLGLGLIIEGTTANQELATFLDASAVTFVDEAASSLEGTYLAPDRRGGSWVRCGERLLRCGERESRLRSGDTVRVSIAGLPRVLESGKRS